MDAEPLKDLLSIEGVIIDEGQKELLAALAQLHDSIAHSHAVFSSKKDLEEIDAACAELSDLWDTRGEL